MNVKTSNLSRYLSDEYDIEVQIAARKLIDHTVALKRQLDGAVQNVSSFLKPGVTAAFKADAIALIRSL